MDEQNVKWIGKEGNFYFRRKQEVVESLIIGKCLNVGCGEHKIKGAKNVDLPEFDATQELCWDKVNKKYDTIILSDVLEHLKILDSIDVLINAIFRTKKRVLITVPAYNWLWSKYDDLLGHKRRYCWKYFDKMPEDFKGCKFTLKISYLFGALLPLFILRKFTSGKTPKLPKWVDTICYWLSKINLPFGSTMLVVIDKIQDLQVVEVSLVKEPADKHAIITKVIDK